MYVSLLGLQQVLSCATQAVVGAGDETGHSRLTHKACLERYRVASNQVMGLLRKLAPNVSASHVKPVKSRGAGLD